MLERLLRNLRSRREAAEAWCAYCGDTPRVELPCGETAYCSEKCQRDDAWAQANGY